MLRKTQYTCELSQCSMLKGNKLKNGIALGTPSENVIYPDCEMKVYIKGHLCYPPVSE